MDGNGYEELRESMQELLNDMIEFGREALQKAIETTIAPAMEEMAEMGARIAQRIAEDGCFADLIREICAVIRKASAYIPTKKDAPRKIGNVRGSMGTVRQPYRARSRI